MDMETESVVILGQDGEFYSRSAPQITKLGPQSNVVARLFADYAFRFPRVTDRFDVYASQAAGIMGLKVLESLTLKTEWQLDTQEGKPVFYPVWMRSQESAPMTFTWSPPENMTILLMRELRPSASGYLTGKAFVLFFDKETKKAFIPPMANVYSSGELCIGSSGEHISRATMKEAMDESERVVQSSAWNNDIMPDSPFYKTLFLRDTDGNQLYTGRDWVEHLHIASSVKFNSVIESYGEAVTEGSSS